jgi:hypothetical protein
MYKKINELEYQWYIIDYGNIYNNKYPLSKLDKDIRDRPLYGQDLLQLLLKHLIFTRNCINNFCKINNIITPLDDVIENYIKNHKKYKKIIKFIPKKKMILKFYKIYLMNHY